MQFPKLKDILSNGLANVLDKGKELIDQVTTDKEEVAKIKLDFEKEVNRASEVILQATLKEFELQLKDKELSINMQIEALKQDDKFSKRYIYYLSSFIIIAATFFGVMLFFIEVPEPNKRMVEMFADIYLFAGALAVLNFYFGSTKSGKDNHTELMQIVKEKK